MQGKIVVLPGGNVQIFADDASFEEAEAWTRTIIASFQAKGIPVELIGKIEQHKDGGTHVHIHDEVRHQQ